MDAIPQGGGSQAQGLAGLFSPTGGPTAKDGKAFGTELTKYIDDANPIQQSHMGGKPEKSKDKKDDAGSNLRQQADIELPFVVPAVIPALNLTPVNAIAVTPAGIESATGVPGKAVANPAAAATTQDTVDTADGSGGNDAPVDSRLNAGCVAGALRGEVVDEKRIVEPLQQMQMADPSEAQEVHAAKDDHRQPAKAGGKEAETQVADVPFNTVKAESEPVRASSPIAQTRHKDDISQRTSGEVHEKKKAVSGKEHGQMQSVSSPEAAPPPTDQTEAPAPFDAVAEAIPAFPVLTNNDTVSTPLEEGNLSRVSAMEPLQAKTPVDRLQPKGNDTKSASPLENLKGTRDHRGGLEEGKRLEQRAGATTAQPGTQSDEQVKQALAKVNGEKVPEVLPGRHPVVNTPSVPANTEHPAATKLPQGGQVSAQEIVAPVTTPADVVRAVRMFERDGQAEMHIGVRSETLGTIDVKATVHDGSVGVSLGVERHEVRSALVSELPGLENTLRERDLRLGEVKFHDMGSTLASEYGNGQQHRSQEFSRPPASAFYRAAKSISESSELPVEMVATIARRGISVHV